MAEISFAIERANNLQGSGLGFYGSTFGSSVQIGSYQSSTSITNGDGTTNGGGGFNVKFLNAASGDIDTGSATSNLPLTYMNGYARTVDVNFDHTAEVNVQNVQLRIYDRFNKDYPASGVNTKVAELINFDGKTYASWNSSAGDDNTGGAGVGGECHGSGDLFWWGEQWDSSLITQNYFENSSGIKFYNGDEADSVVNGDSRYPAAGGGALSDDSVGGTGVVVPLSNSPGSGGRFMDTRNTTGAATYKPKWMQYYNTSARPYDIPNIGANQTAGTFGGTGIDTRHTWRVALSATPLTIGSKTQYGLYVSLEYL